MRLAFYLLAGWIMASAVAAVVQHRLVHAVLCLTLAFAGMAAVFVQLGAEFVGFAQVLIYVGAIAILLVFTVLLTRQGGMSVEVRWRPPGAAVGLAVAGLVTGCLLLAIGTSTGLGFNPPPDIVAGGTHRLGEQLLTRYVVPLEVLAVLLTAAWIGAAIVVLAADEKR